MKSFQIVMTLKKQKKKLKKFRTREIREECGVFGIHNIPDASTLVALGLHALQHRGQEGCGIVSYDRKNFHSEKKHGLVGDNFTNKEVLKKLPGNSAIGHNRYSTAGNNLIKNVQPFFADLYSGHSDGPGHRPGKGTRLHHQPLRDTGQQA